MLPERLSTDLTSLNPGQDRLALVTEMTVAEDASITQSTLYRATVRNQAKLAYDAVAAWIEVSGHCPRRPVRYQGWSFSFERKTQSPSDCVPSGRPRGPFNSRPSNPARCSRGNAWSILSSRSKTEPVS